MPVRLGGERRELVVAGGERDVDGHLAHGVAREAQLGEHDELGALRAGARERAAGRLEVRRDVAEHAVDLRERDAEGLRGSHGPTV